MIYLSILHGNIFAWPTSSLDQASPMTYLSCTYTVKLPLVDNWPLVDALVQSIAHLQLSVHGCSKAGDKHVVDGLMHKYAVSSHAGLVKKPKTCSYWWWNVTHNMRGLRKVCPYLYIHSNVINGSRLLSCLQECRGGARGEADRGYLASVAKFWGHQPLNSTG